jgi:hypothetical protein
MRAELAAELGVQVEIAFGGGDRAGWKEVRHSMGSPS